MGGHRIESRGAAVTKPYLLLLAALPAAAALAPGCASSVVVPKTVNVYVPTACISPAGRPARPAVRTEAELMAMDRYTRTLAAWSDRTRLEIYAAELEAVVEGCSRIPP
jgi:hypothetical protein